jgi:hypothetical protein
MSSLTGDPRFLDLTMENNWQWQLSGREKLLPFALVLRVHGHEGAWDRCMARRDSGVPPVHGMSSTTTVPAVVEMVGCRKSVWLLRHLPSVDPRIHVYPRPASIRPISVYCSESQLRTNSKCLKATHGKYPRDHLMISSNAPILERNHKLSTGKHYILFFGRSGLDKVKIYATRSSIPR